METAAVTDLDLSNTVAIVGNTQINKELSMFVNPLHRIFHGLALKLSHHADLGEIAYLMLRKLVILHPVVASDCLAPLLVSMLRGRAESLKQHHIQHKQRASSTKIIASFFDEFVFVRQEHRIMLFILGLCDAMSSTFLRRSTGTQIFLNNLDLD